MQPQPIKKKTPLKPPVKNKEKPYPMPKILPSKPGAKKPVISVGGIGNKEVNPIYRNQGF